LSCFIEYMRNRMHSPTIKAIKFVVTIYLDVNLLGDNIDTIKKNTEISIDASNEVGLEINVQKTMYMLLYCHQNVGQNRDIKITNRSFEKCFTVQIFGDDSNK
jgi:hypothetical protein